MPGPIRWILTVCLATLLLPTTAYPQQPLSPEPGWALRSRVVLSGNSDESEPAGYEVYSGMGIEAALSRRLGGKFTTELTLRFEPREVDRLTGPGPSESLGSVELLPVSLLLRFEPKQSGKLRPYGGAGINLTVAWEKTGQLNSLDVSPHLGPALQLGTDYFLSGRMFLNLDLRWNTLDLDIKDQGQPVTTLNLDPIAFGLGVGVRF